MPNNLQMPEKLSLKMINEGLLALFALQYGPCRVTPCRVLAKDTSAHSLAAICLSVHMHTLCAHMCPSSGTPRSFLSHAGETSLSQRECCWAVLPKPHEMHFSHSTRESQVHFEFLWPVVVKRPVKQHSSAGGFDTTCNPNFKSLITNLP